MRLLLVTFLLTALCGPPAVAQETQSSPVFDRIEEMVVELAEITGLEIKHSVPYATIERDGLKKFLEDRVAEQIEPEELKIEETLLKAFGFVPEDFDLRKMMIDLYTEQAAAFYDFHRKKLFVLESGDAAMEEAALFHELAHALADQHFRLERYLEEADEDDDAAMARMAVMEGQATWLMAEKMARNLGQSLTSSPEMVRMMSIMIRGSSDDYPVFANAPLYIRESLTFPYTMGMKLQQAAVERYEKRGFTMLFERPPSSTRHVMHPETYFAREHPESPKFARLRKRRSYKRLAEGALGEFDYAILFEQFLNEDAVRRLAPAWRGGTYRLVERRKSEGHVLMHSSVWDTEESAEGVLEAWKKILAGKWERVEFDETGPEQFSGTGDSGHFEFRRRGRVVYGVEGIERPSDVRKWPEP